MSRNKRREIIACLRKFFTQKSDSHIIHISMKFSNNYLWMRIQEMLYERYKMSNIHQISLQLLFTLKLESRVCTNEIPAYRVDDDDVIIVYFLQLTIFFYTYKKKIIVLGFRENNLQKTKILHNDRVSYRHTRYWIFFPYTKRFNIDQQKVYSQDFYFIGTINFYDINSYLIVIAIIICCMCVCVYICLRNGTIIIINRKLR